MVVPAGHWVCYKALSPMLAIASHVFSIDSAIESLYSICQFMEERVCGDVRANSLFMDDYMLPAYWEKYCNYICKEVYDDTNHQFTFKTPNEGGIDVRSYGLFEDYVCSVGQEKIKAHRLWLLGRAT